jgi:LysM repeat protein
MIGTGTARDWKLVAVVAAVAVAVATFLSVAAIQAVRVSGRGSAVSPKVAAAPSPSSQAKKAATSGVSQVGDKVYYTVQPFDVNKRVGTLTFIAQRFHTTVGRLVEWNNIKDPDHINVHQRLRVQ